MRSRYRWMIFGAAASTLIFLPLAAPQSDADREARAREYIRFIVTELDQWTTDFPKAYDMALVRPPVDAGKLSEASKAAADDLRDGVKRLTTLSKARDLAGNTAFTAQLSNMLQAAGAVNEALGAQRFPQSIENDWVRIRTNLNSLADIYKLPQLTALDAPGPGGGRRFAAAEPPLASGAVAGYIVDQRCAAQGKAMWTNAKCIQNCVQDGEKVVLVTEAGKVYQIVNQDKIETDAYGQKVAVTGKTEGDTITVSGVQLL